MSISPTFYEQLFLTNVLRPAFLYLKLGFILFWYKKIEEKSFLKMLKWQNGSISTTFRYNFFCAFCGKLRKICQKEQSFVNGPIVCQTRKILKKCITSFVNSVRRQTKIGKQSLMKSTLGGNHKKLVLKILN
jgi:hypothetical protein